MQKFIGSSGMSSTDAMASVDCTLKKPKLRRNVSINGQSPYN